MGGCWAVKKVLPVLAVFCLLAAGGCGGADRDARRDSPAMELFDVSITLPAVDPEDVDSAVAEAEELGIERVLVNDDGSVTCEMSSSVHNRIMKEMRESFAETAEELKNDPDFPSIKDVAYNNKLTAVTLIVDREMYENSLDAFVVFGLGLAAVRYQLFDGVKADKLAVTIDLADFGTGRVFSSMVFPDALEDDS